MLSEGRALWLGHKGALGYFFTWDQSEPGQYYFDLDDSAVSNILALIPSPVIDSAAPSDSPGPNTADDLTNRVRDLLKSVSAPEPDTETIRQIIEDVPTSDEGIDILALVASVKAFRRTLKNLKSLLDTQDERKHPESLYQGIIAANPWMLGSQYTEVLGTEYMLALGARIDLMLSSALGQIEIVELKRPDAHPLVRHGKTWAASSDLSSAQAQARKYLQIVDEQRLQIEERLQITNKSVLQIYRSRVIIVIGRRPKEKEALQTLQDMNVTLGRILILTYDDIVAFAEAAITIFERKLNRPVRLLL